MRVAHHIEPGGQGMHRTASQYMQGALAMLLACRIE